MVIVFEITWFAIAVQQPGVVFFGLLSIAVKAVMVAQSSTISKSSK